MLDMDGYDAMVAAEVCATHEDSLHGECDDCQAEALTKAGILNDQTGAIVRLQDELKSHGVRMPDTLVIGIRLEALVETLAERDRFRYEARVNDTMLTMLEEAQREVNTPKLHVVSRDQKLAHPSFGIK